MYSKSLNVNIFLHAFWKVIFSAIQLIPERQEPTNMHEKIPCSLSVLGQDDPGQVIQGQLTSVKQWNCLQDCSLRFQADR